MAYIDPAIEHLLRRAGFGARPDELDVYRTASITGAVSRLINFDRIPDDVDAKIGVTGYASTTARNATGFNPRINILDARQRWLFRMIHSNRPLQEKMTLFWHNHFATGYTKIAGQLGADDATRYMAAKRSEDPNGVQGQIEMLRENALGNFRDILVNIAKDVAMLYWLDGYLNVRTRPQENFGREIMELFTSGVGYYKETDVYAAARVFTGWNVANRNDPQRGSYREFVFNAGNHDTGEKTFSFPIYPDGGQTIPARAAAQGMQDGLDFIDGLCARPETGRYLAKKLYRFFINETDDIDGAWVDRIADVFHRRNYEMSAVLQEVLLSREFWDSENSFARYAWPVEFVIRSIKDVGWAGFSVNDALTPLGNMGQNLYDPPDVAGWDLGQSWFSTGSMLARMNFASTLAGNQRFNLATKARSAGADRSPEALRGWVLESLRTPPFDNRVLAELDSYLRATGAWTGSSAQVQNKVTGLVHLVAGTPEYQFV